MSETCNRVVAWDPKGEYWEGSLVPARFEPQLAARGAALLPCVPELFKRGGAAGYVKRSWGAGFPLDVGVPRMHCPITMLVLSGYNILHWRARLVSSPEFDERAKDTHFRPGGMLRFVGDGGREQVTHLHATQVTPAIDAREIGAKDAAGGWTVGGRVLVQPQNDAHCGFALYGAGDGLRVVWLAVTATKDGY